VIFEVSLEVVNLRAVYQETGEIADETTAQCQSIQRSHASHLDSPVVLTLAPEFLQALPGPPAAIQSALRLYKSILRCSWKHVQLWRGIRDTI